MSTIRIEKRRGYSVIANACFMDDRLSYRAIGLLCYLLSKPDDWQVRVGELVGSHREGRDAVYATIKELGENGYITRETGFGSVNYIVHESPITAENQHTVFQDTGNQDTGNPLLLSTDENKVLMTTKETTTNQLSALRVEDLNTLIHAYPKHRVVAKDKEAIAAIWNDRVAVNEVPPISYILERLEKQKSSDDWTKDSGRWVPKIQNYIGNRGWDTVVVYDKPTGNLSYSERQASLAAGGQGRVVV